MTHLIGLSQDPRAASGWLWLPLLWRRATRWVRRQVAPKSLPKAEQHIPESIQKAFRNCA